jgi:hypothetical protein
MIVQLWCNLTQSFKEWSTRWVNDWEYEYSNITYAYTTHTTTEPMSHKCCIDTNQLDTLVSCDNNSNIIFIAIFIVMLFAMIFVVLVFLSIITAFKTCRNRRLLT